VVKGNVEVLKMAADVNPNNLLIQQEDGSFKEGAKIGGAFSFELGRGGALIDLNKDGALDLVISNRQAKAEIWRNKGVKGNWLRLKLSQPDSNPRGVGSWIEVKTKGRLQRREITIGGGHAGGQWGWLHFGLDKAKSAQVRFQQPGEKWSSWMPVSANRSIVIK